MRAQEVLRKYQKQIDAEGIEVGVSRQALDEVLDRITELENPWISVDDPPTPDRNILLRFDNGEICTGYLCMMRGEYIPDDLAQHLSDVHHWMHLNWNDPPPPEAT